MKFEIDTDTFVEKVAAQMKKNFEKSLKNKNLTDEEINATVVLNKKKIAEEADNLSSFIIGLYLDDLQEELPL